MPHRNRTPHVFVAALSAAVLLAGCSSAGGPRAFAPPASLSIEGRSAKEVVDMLDRTNADRGGDTKVSVRQQEVVVSRGGREEKRLPMPAGETYVSVAPYVTSTHECFNHNVTTCQGEMVNKQVHVTISDAAGKKLVDEDATTYENGFVGFWLPRDVKGTLTVTADGRAGTVPLGTGAEDPTCITTLRLA